MTQTSFSISLTQDVGISLRGKAGAEIVGRPGSGKSMLSTYILMSSMKFGAFPILCDTKRSDFFHMGQQLDRQNHVDGKEVHSCVASTPSQVAGLLRILVKLMNDRYMTFNSWGKDWVDFDLKPIILVFDEYAATISEADKKTANEIETYMKQLVYKSRQLGGIYTLVCSQRLNSDVLDVNVSAEFATRIAMENLDPISLKLIFPQCSTGEIPIIDNIPGHGLIYSDALNSNIPIEFVAPDISLVNVPKVVLTLDRLNRRNNSFRHENYWPFSG